MSFSVLHTDGHGEDDPSLDTLVQLLEELAFADEEHRDISVIHQESAWCVSVHGGGRLVLENLRQRTEAKHMTGVSAQVALAIMELVARGNIESAFSHPWNPGYG